MYISPVPSNENNAINNLAKPTNGSISNFAKPIKVQLSKKEKKENFGIILGCKYFIEEIIEDSSADCPEANIRLGDTVLKVI